MTTGGGPIYATEMLSTYTYKLAFSDTSSRLASASAVLHSDPLDERDLLLHQASEGEVAAMAKRSLGRTVLPTALTYVGLVFGLVFAASRFCGCFSRR